MSSSVRRVAGVWRLPPSHCTCVGRPAGWVPRRLHCRPRGDDAVPAAGVRTTTRAAVLCRAGVPVLRAAMVRCVTHHSPRVAWPLTALVPGCSPPAAGDSRRGHNGCCCVWLPSYSVFLMGWSSGRCGGTLGQITRNGGAVATSAFADVLRASVRCCQREMELAVKCEASVLAAARDRQRVHEHVCMTFNRSRATNNRKKRNCTL